MAIEKLPPHDIEAEDAVVASCLVDPGAIWKVAAILQPEDFFREANRWIYEAILSTVADGGVANQITVAHELARKDRLEQIGGTAHLSELISNLPTPVGVEYYARDLLRVAQHRQLIGAAQWLAQAAFQRSEEPQVLGGQATQQIQEIVARGKKRRTGLEALDDYMARQTNTMRGLHLSFPSLEYAVPGILPGEVMIVAALTSVGKTAFVLNIAHNLTILQKKRVAFFSVEMNLDALTERFLSLMSQVSQEKVQRKSFSESEIGRINFAAGLYSEAQTQKQLVLIDAAAWTVEQVLMEAHTLHAQAPLDLIIVDYLGALNTKAAYDSRVQEVSYISRSLKALARDLDRPLIAVSQLSRQANERDMPKLSDLRDSGSLEQDAAVVAFLHWVNRQQLIQRTIRVKIAKQRNGPLDEQELFFHAPTGKFSDPKESNP